MNAVTQLPPGVFAVTVPAQLNLLQRTALYLIDQACQAHPEGLVCVETIYRSGIFSCRRETTNMVTGLAELGWLQTHDYCFKPSPKASKWLQAEGAHHKTTATEVTQ